MPVGRLDLNTEGLLLLTNDGEFKRAMELPASGIPRTYRARAFGDVTQTQLEALIEGVTIDGIHYGSIDANLERGAGRNRWIEMTLTEGKNREVRRVLEHLGLEVSRLIRTAYGLFVLGDLAKGQAVEVRKEELERFRSSLKGSSARRGGDRPARPKVDPVPDDRPPRPQRRSSPASATGGAKANRREAPTGGKSRGRSSPSRKGPKA
jgi:23S rRNA pseudouridine2605 synthase